ncbi:MAG: hypothetical protein B7Z58_16925 [Acidiphilium sp. 37-64-53]|uniref:hypothetical protein n=1 Tax=Acidiphilium TaxID=522 RepID=UPI000BD8C09B|nr:MULTISPECIES: hypothetical protein [Acidiphilium]OYW00021.1 MAG: hypothetical protein B7Z58_16925 [Acidiphilium sp. 37-64-53]OZB23292.1 MAG: hypothetical protein B7X49_16150 [Acidiphilium sp. 34-64-41]HQT86658.1 hypothetical protein [Acidiphilium rubrum]
MKTAARHAGPLLGLIVLPCLANLLLILGIMHADPALFYRGLTLGLHTGPFPAPGSPTWADPTIGLITQAQGMLSAKDWLAGIIPWWNPYTGVGMPLAAEMQTLSFFLPFVLLLRLTHGWLILRLVLQSLSGAALYALLLDLGTTRFAAFVAGALYGLSGIFFLVPHAAGPLPFMPLLLLGIERATRAARTHTPRGWGLIAFATAAMIYAGYPETAYFGGLLAAAWTLRALALAGADRIRLAGKIMVGLILALALAAPLLIPFADYVRISYYGPHDGYFSLIAWPASAMLSVLPFMVGPIAGPIPPALAATASGPIDNAWWQTGTWFGIIAIAIALIAIIPRHRERGRAIMLGCIIAFGMLRIEGIDLARKAFNLIPFVGTTDAIRFVTPALDLALLIMVGLALDHWQRRGALPRRTAAIAGAIGLGLILIVTLPHRTQVLAWYHASQFDHRFALIACGTELAAALACLAIMTKRPSRPATIMLALLALGDATATMASGQAAAAWSSEQATGGIRFLQAHQGLGRFFTLGPFGPDYPAADRLASINTNQLPVAAAWIDFGNTALGLQPAAPLAAQAASLRSHLAAFRAIGVTAILTPPGLDPFRDSTRLMLDATNVPGASLQGSATIQGSLPASTPVPERISTIGVQIGTYDGASTGPLNVTLCAGSNCATGEASLDHAADNASLPIALDHPLRIPPHTALHYKFTHPSGNAVVLWMGRIAGTTITAPHLRFDAPQPNPAPRLIYRDRAMWIYRLPGAAPFYTAPGCTITNASLNRVTTDCAAPATLIRREAWFGGWHAIIGYHPVIIARHGPLFQAIALPAGRSRIRFFYRPRHTRLACLLALAALGLALILQTSARLGGGGRARL